KTVEYPEIPIHYFGRETARLYPHQLAIYSVQDERKYSYLEFMHQCDKMAAGLKALGVKKGDGIGVYMANSPEFIFTVYGISLNGAVIIPINPMLKAPDIEHIIKDSTILKTIIYSSIFHPIVEQVKQKVEIENLIVSGEKIPGTISLEELIEQSPAEPPQVDINPKEDLCVLLYTGGTTGAPKGVMISHYNLTSNVLQMAASEPEERAQEVNGAVLTVLPMCHSFGFSQVQLNLAMGSLMILNHGFDPPEVMGLIEKYKAVSFVGIPLMYAMLVNDPNFGKYDMSSLRMVISGAAPLPIELNNRWKKATGMDVRQGYGLSETSPTTHINSPWLETAGDSIGVPVVDTDARIVDPEDKTTEVGPGEVGELLIKGPQVMHGYWRNPEKTAEALKDGWLYTGDLAFMDEKGNFYIAGRQSDMIKYKGYKVLPDEVENSLYKHPAVLECAVLGVPDPDIGETIKAFVVLRDEYKGKVTEDEIREWARVEMAGYKWPRIVEFIDQVPRTAVGKVFRRALREGEKDI
ncbi:MAG: AMP-binding protein, partial [Deltaproteobacteria bacterium]|nr:AMP-binding protein [Deltaproteobacteria bacterium]